MSAAISFTVLGLPPTDNNIYRGGTGKGRYLTQDAKDWKQRVEVAWFTGTTRDQRIEMQAAFYAVTFTYAMELYAKKGTFRRWDPSSHQKLTLDALATAMHSDDTRCLHQTIEKIQSQGGGPQTHIYVQRLPKP